jgi:death-on-curing protein
VNKPLAVRPRDYLTLEDVLDLHRELIRRWGGTQGIRDPGLLEAALYRPQTGYYPSLVDEASALWESLSQNHAFLDGNKRIAFAATFVFLRINGLRITAENAVAEEFILGLYERREVRFDLLRAWLLENTEATEGSTW